MYIIRAVQFGYGRKPYEQKLNLHADSKRLPAAPTTPRQPITAYSIHSSAEDFRTAIRIEIMKVTTSNIKIVTVVPYRGTIKKHKRKYNMFREKLLCS